MEMDVCFSNKGSFVSDIKKKSHFIQTNCSKKGHSTSVIAE